MSTTDADDAEHSRNRAPTSRRPRAPPQPPPPPIWNDVEQAIRAGPIAHGSVSHNVEHNLLRLIMRAVDAHTDVEAPSKSSSSSTTMTQSIVSRDTQKEANRARLARLTRLRRQLVLRAARRALRAPQFCLDSAVSAVLRKSLDAVVPMSTAALPPLLRGSDGVWRRLTVRGMRQADAVTRLAAVARIGYIPYQYSFRARLLGPRLPLHLAVAQAAVSGDDHDENQDKRDGIASLDCLRGIRQVQGSAAYHVPSIEFSPYTAKTLPRYIWRDFNSAPPFKHILADICGLEAHEMYPIDYIPMNRDYLTQVNHLLSNVFWDGIDVSESLNWPDYGILALYNGVVVGCALMVPDGYISYIVVRPGWDGAGIGSFMLAWLAKMSSGKDLTLHVSANNRAMLLYQKFGFKPEEFIVNFYGAFFRKDSLECKNAFFIRLRV